MNYPFIYQIGRNYQNQKGGSYKIVKNYWKRNENELILFWIAEDVIFGKYNW